MNASTHRLAGGLARRCRSVHRVAAGLAIVVNLWLGSGNLMAAEARTADYRGWKSLELTNGLVEVHVVPDIGGRVIQFKLGEFEFFWVNPQLAGKAPPPSGLDPQGNWLNYGGEKLWPAPQGWDNDQQWPGPPDAILDGGPHAGSIRTPKGNSAAVRLVSRPDPRTGIQFSRVIRLFDGSSHVHVDATMTNADRRPRRWGIWSVMQHDASNRSGPGYNKNLRVWCPISPKSVLPGGYKVMFGDADNPSFQPDQQRRLMQVHYQRRVGKIGMDCSAGWMATVNGAAGYALVQRFPCFPEKKYPDGASVEIWLHGAGKYVTGGKVHEMKDDPIETPYFLETEILSPFAELKPGQSYTFGQDWYAASVGGDYPVLGCTDVGVTCEPFWAKVADGKTTLAGRFGVFYRGKLDVAFLDAEGKRLSHVPTDRRVGPEKPLVLDGDFKAPAPPPGATQAVLLVVDDARRELGELARTRIE